MRGWRVSPSSANVRIGSKAAIGRPGPEDRCGRYAQPATGPRRLLLGDKFTRTPLDVERVFPNMRRGDLLVGAFTNGQIGADRPFPGAGRYRAHVDGLYLCGSSSHPGGNITGLPGYNAAQVVLDDLGIEA